MNEDELKVIRMQIAHFKDLAKLINEGVIVD